jgi:photosystem II stability/assembly factor-like uncharacterized protein
MSMISLRRKILRFASTLVIGLVVASSLNGQRLFLRQPPNKAPKNSDELFQVKSFGSSVLNSVSFANKYQGCAVGDAGTVLCTNNGGRTWVKKVMSTHTNLNSIFLRDGQGWIVGNFARKGVALRTSDGGRTWKLMYRLENFDSSTLSDVWFIDDRRGWAVGEATIKEKSFSIIVTTMDGGSHWEEQYRAGEGLSGLRAIRFTDETTGWAVGDGVILHTDDRGRHWTEQLHDPKRYFFALDMVTPTEGWAVGSGGLLLHTNNGGTSWESQSLPIEKKDIWLSTVKFVNSRRGWVAGDDGAIFSTSDGGKRWKLETVGTSPFLRGLASTSLRIFAVGNNGIILRRRL